MAGAHPLHLAGQERVAVAHRVAMTQHPLHHHGDDLHVAVGMHAKALPASDLVIVDHQQRAKASPGRIVVASKAEAVPTLQPAVLAQKPLLGPAKHQAGAGLGACGCHGQHLHGSLKFACVEGSA